MPIRAKLLLSASPSEEGDRSLGGESAANALGRVSRIAPSPQNAKRTIAQNRCKGEKQGRIEGKLTAVPHMLALGLSVEQVAEALGLEVEEVRQAAQTQPSD